MIKGEATDEEIDELDEASALKEYIAYACKSKIVLVLGWHTLDESIKKGYGLIYK